MKVRPDREPMAEWLRRQGHRLLVSESAIWYDPAPGVLMAFPYYPAIEPSKEELRRVFREGRARALRYSAPLSSVAGKVSYHVVCATPSYGLEHVSRQSRQNIRKGLEYATYEPITFARMAKEGWALREDTLTRQGRLKAESPEWWKRMCLSAEGLAGFEAWGALRGRTLAAALIVYLDGDTYFMLYQQSLTEHLRFGVNNALGFVFTRYALARPGVKELFYGLESLDAAPNVDEFKFRMGYEARAVRQRVVFHPVLRPVMTKTTLAALGFAGRIDRRHPAWLKAAGMLRFYLEGNLPLAKQVCPECLLPQRDAWLGVKSQTRKSEQHE